MPQLGRVLETVAAKRAKRAGGGDGGGRGGGLGGGGGGGGGDGGGGGGGGPWGGKARPPSFVRALVRRAVCEGCAGSGTAIGQGAARQRRRSHPPGCCEKTQRSAERSTA